MSAESEAFDPDRASTGALLSTLFFQPRRFFEGFRGKDGVPVPSSLFIVAVIGLFTAVWIAEVSKLLWLPPLSIDEIRQQLEQIGDFSALPPAFNSLIDSALPYVAASSSALRHMWLVFAPLSALAQALLAALSALIFLPLLGVERSRISFSRLMLAQLFASWTLVIGIVPFVGDFIAIVWTGLYMVFAVQWAYGIGFWRALVARSILLWLLMLFALAVFSFLTMMVLFGH